MASQALTTAPGGAAIAKRDTSPFGQLKRQLETREVDFRAALASKGISVKDFLGSVSIAVAQDPELLNADRASLILSALRAAQDGLHPDKREAALVIFKQNKKLPNGQWESLKLVQYMPMVYGLRKKILQARDADGKPIVSSLQVGIVYRIEVENGYFLWERGSEPEVQHRPMLEIPADEATDDKIVAAYSIATMSDGTRSCEVMRRFEIDKVRECSQTGATRDRKGKAREPSGPWVEWFPEQCKKTVMRRHSKTLPMSGDVIASLGDENEDDYAQSAMAIASGSGEGPVLIEDGSGAQFDAATGEVISGGADAAETVAHDQDLNPEADQGKQARGGKVKAEKAQPERAEAEQEPEQEQERDPNDFGLAEDECAARADDYLGRFSKAETLIDLNRAHADFDGNSDGWPYEIVQLVQNGYGRHKRRLSQPETADAK